MPDTSTKTILAADIGGTHSRFALFHLDTDAPLTTLRLARRVRFSTHASTDTAAMMRLLAESSGDDGGFFLPASRDPVRVHAAVFGIPGPAAVADIEAEPPEGEICYCPNIRWPLEAKPVVEALEGAPVRFINDFVANGFACALLPHITDAVTVLAGQSRPRFPRAVIGAGTGLGHCLILPGEPPVVVGSEAGHTLFPFSRDETGIYGHFVQAYGTDRIDGDMAVAGAALAHIYALCTGETVHPHEVAPLAASRPRVMEYIATLYGRAVMHYILNTLPLGGVFITGGLAANLPGVLTHPAFVAELRERNPMGRSLGAIPVMHVRNGDLGLWGSAAFAALMVRKR
ncbi:MAG: glucokinase [Deltaproteobacteria bacterium]|nr:glucokinase [Deltaproteobacteria bacterium]